ncbi:MAG: hypothetical protein II879_13980 [Clostridia bacterium]|nr:hypothetical protein [Clostridia bacterium]
MLLSDPALPHQQCRLRIHQALPHRRKADQLALSGFPGVRPLILLILAALCQMPVRAQPLALPSWDRVLDQELSLVLLQFLQLALPVTPVRPSARYLIHQSMVQLFHASVPVYLPVLPLAGLPYSVQHPVLQTVHQQWRTSQKWQNLLTKRRLCLRKWWVEHLITRYYLMKWVHQCCLYRKRAVRPVTEHPFPH